MIYSCLTLLLCCIIVQSKHFYGGIIDWEPIYPYSNTSIVPITITQSYSWNADEVDCKPNVPITTSGRTNENVNLTCVAGCSTDGGYSLKPVNILTDCQSVDTLMNVISSQRSVNISLTAGASFRIAYEYNAWIPLNYPVISGLFWSMVCWIDLRFRSDGFINTPPVAIVVSPQYAVVNRTTKITIPVYDVNAGDDVRCRWAIKNQSIDECSGICYPSSVPNGTVLSGCTILFRAYVVNTYYGVAIQVEDFVNGTSLTPMSSIPVQFLVYVTNAACGLAPVILPPNVCFDVQVGTPLSFNLSAMTTCNPNVSDINSIKVTSGIVGLSLSNITNSRTNASVSYVTIRWTPQANQVGSQRLCLIAYSDEKLQSDQYCMTFDVKTSSSMCITTTTTTTSTSRTTTTTTSTSTTTTRTTTSSTSSTSTSTTTTRTTTTTSSSTTSSSTSSTSTSTTTTRTTTSTSTSTSTTSSSTSTSTTSTSTTSSSTSTSTTSTSTTSSSTTTTTTTDTSTTVQTITEGPHLSVMSIVILVILAFFFMTSCCCCLYWLCSSCSEEHHQTSLEEEMETVGEETSTIVEDVTEMTPRPRLWMPVMGVRMFPIRFIRTLFVPAFKSPRATPSPYSSGSITIITDRR